MPRPENHREQIKTIFTYYIRVMQIAKFIWVRLVGLWCGERWVKWVAGADRP